MMRSIPTILLLLGAVARAGEVDFARNVLPVLSDACFQCHGPDEHARKAKLRLDQKEGVFRTKEGVTVVKAGAPAESELVVRITSTDPEEQMPPPKANRKLKPEEVEMLRQWVAQGAKWGKHWAFEPITNPEPPVVPGAAGARNEIDQFVLARLEQAGVAPAPE